MLLVFLMRIKKTERKDYQISKLFINVYRNMQSMTNEEIDPRIVYEDIMTMQPKYETLSENLYWAWANWEVIKIANDGKVKPFDRIYYMMRQKFFKLYMQGKRHITDLYTFNKEKLRAGDFCFYCYEKVPKEELTADHVFPRTKGGANDLNNIIFVCKHCNSSKGKKELLQWFMHDQGRFPSPFVLGHYLKQINRFATENGLLDKTISDLEKMVLPFHPRSVLLLHTKRAHRWYYWNYKKDNQNH